MGNGTYAYIAICALVVTALAGYLTTLQNRETTSQRLDRLNVELKQTIRTVEAIKESQ